MKPPHHPTNKSKKQRERPPRAEGRSSAASSHHPSPNGENNRHQDASTLDVELPHRPRQYRQCDENESPSLATWTRRGPCDACHRRQIKCRHPKTQPQSLCEARKPSSGPASDGTSDAAGSEVPALQEASDLAGDTSSSSEDGERFNSCKPIIRYADDLRREANPFPWGLGSLSDGNNVRWTTKDGTVDIGTQVTLDSFDENVIVDGSCPSQKDVELNSYLPLRGNQSVSVYVTIPSDRLHNWRLEDGQVGATSPLRGRQSRRRAATQASPLSRNNERRQSRQATTSVAQEIDGQDERISSSVASGPPPARAESQALGLEASSSSQDLRDHPLQQPATLLPQTPLYLPTQDFHNNDSTFPAVANEASMLQLANGEHPHPFYYPINPYPQQQYTPNMMAGAHPNEHYHQSSSAAMDYGGQTHNFYGSQQQQQYPDNFQDSAGNMMGDTLGEVTYQMLLTAPTNHLVPAQMIPSLPQQYSPNPLQYARNMEMNFGGERQHPVALSAPTDHYEQVQFGQNPGEMPMIQDTATAAAATTAQFPYGDVTYLDSNTNNFSPQSANAAYAPVGPYDHTMTAQRPTSDTSANIPSLTYDSGSTPTDRSGGGQYARSTLSGSSPPDEAPLLRVGEMGEALSNGYQMPPAESTPMSMTTSTEEAFSGMEKSPFTDPVFPYGNDMDSEELIE